ncbi:DUF2884 family protein [Marinobacter alexandrii]|uniref:DUF2884 family protein n=1 Tax=Marinobacter alexandrii TaxID=2570351 RepID=UPI003297F2F6
MRQWLLVAVAALLAMPVWAADECNINIQHDITVTHQSLLVSQKNKELYQIVQKGYLSVGGKDVELSDEQRALTEHYAGEVAALVPQIIELVNEALTVAGKSLDVALTGVFGEGSELSSKPAKAMEEARIAFNATAKPEEGVYRLVSEDYESFGENLEAELEGAVGDAMGAMMSQMGSAMTSGEGSFVEKMEAFGERMELVGEEIEASASVLEETGDALCQDMREIRTLERELTTAVPELKGYSLFE